MRPHLATSSTVCVLAAIAAYSVWYAQESLFVDRGDAYADCFVLVSGKHFADSGFAACRFLPIHQPGPLTYPPTYYTHYPPFPDWVNGLQRILFGWDSLFLFRLGPISAFYAGCFAFYLFCRRLWGPWVAFASVTYLATREMNFALADSIHGHAYHESLRLLGFYLVIRLGETPGSPHRVVSLCGVVFVNAWTSYESILDLQLFSWGYLLWIKRSPVLIPLAVSAAAGTAFTLQQGLNVWAVGPSHFTELADTLRHRMVENGDWTMRGYLDLLASRFHSLAGIHLPFVLVAAAGFFLTHRRAEERESNRVLGLLIAAGGSWWLIFPSHSIIHWFTFRHILPALAILLGGVAVKSWDSVRDGRRPWTSRAGAAALLGVAAFSFCSETFLRATPPIRETSEDLVFEEVRAWTEPAEVVLTNWNRVPFVRYGTDRRAERAATLEQLAREEERLPPGRSAAVFLYREDLDHQRAKASDPLYVYLEHRYDRTDRGQWTVFRLHPNDSPPPSSFP